MIMILLDRRKEAKSAITAALTTTSSAIALNLAARQAEALILLPDQDQSNQSVLLASFIGLI